MEKNKIQVLLLKYHNSHFPTKIKSYNTLILGKKMIDWVKDACLGYPIKEINMQPNTSIVDNIMPHLGNNKYVVVLFCDTPLITKQTLYEFVDYAVLKQLDYLSSDRGYVFNVDYLKRPDKDQVLSQEFTHKSVEFTPVKNYIDLEKTTHMLQQNINNLHMAHGVNIINSSLTYIEPTVTIDPGVTIYPNNYIKGNSDIKSNSVLYNNNIIDNSLVKENAKIHNSFIKNCVISKNSYIKPFSHYENILVNEKM